MDLRQEGTTGPRKAPAIIVRRPVSRRPVSVGTPRLVAFPDHLAYRRQSPPARSGEVTARWSGNATRRAVPTDKGRRTIIAVACGPAGPVMAEIHQPSAPGATLKLSRWCRAQRSISNKYQAEVGNPSLIYVSNHPSNNPSGKHTVKITRQ